VLQSEIDRPDFENGVGEPVRIAEFDIAHFKPLETLRRSNGAPLFHDERLLQRLLQPIDPAGRDVGVEQDRNRLHEPETSADHEQERRGRFRDRCAAKCVA
jgi:hypothetical protein